MTFSSSASASASAARNSRKRTIPDPADPANRDKNPRNVLTKTIARKSAFTDVGSYMVEKNRKLRTQFEADASTSSLGGSDRIGIFHGISIFVDGFTVPSSQELKGYMLKHGGQFENYFSRHRVTHIICSHLPDRKIRNLRAFSRGLPVVKPAWLVDCVAASELLSWVPYQLEELVNETRKQQKLSSFFAPKGISSFKVAEIHGEPLVKFNIEGLLCRDERLKHLLLHEEGECSKSERQGSDSSDETAYVGRNAELTFTDLEDENSIIEASESSPHRPSNKVSIVSFENINFMESLDVQHLEASGQQHSTLKGPMFVEKSFKVYSNVKVFFRSVQFSPSFPSDFCQRELWREILASNC